MASPRTESRGGSPRHGIARQNISAGGSPVGNPIVAQVRSAKGQLVTSYTNVFIGRKMKEMSATRRLETMRQ